MEGLKDHQIQGLVNSIRDNLEKDVKNLDNQNWLTKKGKMFEIFEDRARLYRGQKFRYVEMNKPAYSLLVMGFSGKRALYWKRRVKDR